jgi:multicomponent Na+:H+ antiporter subunit D
VTGEPVLWTTLLVIGPLIAGLIALEGRPRMVRLGLGIGSFSALVGVAGLWNVFRLLGPVTHPLGGWGAPLGIELRVEGFPLLMLAMTAMVGTAVSLYATAYFGDISSLEAEMAPAGRGARYFAPLWLLLWCALNGLYLSGDLFNLYVMIEIIGISAAAIVTLAVTSSAIVAGTRYLIISLIGSLFFLLGIALFYIATGTLALEALPDPLAGDALPMAALAAMTVGLAAKTALFPFHAWLPSAHAAAPAPGSALLSALVVKGSFYVTVRLWVDVYGADNQTGMLVLGVLGAVAILWGSILALRQDSLKRLIAYSTIAQLGYLFVMFPLLRDGQGLWIPDAWSGGIYHAAAHGVAKAAMFLAAGNLSYAVARDALPGISGVAQRLPMTFFAFTLGGLSLAGIPPSGGFVSKWFLLRAAIAAERWPAVVLIAIGGLLTVAYILKVLRHAVDRTRPPDLFRPVPRRMEWAALALALVAVGMGIRASELLALLSAGELAP